MLLDELQASSSLTRQVSTWGRALGDKGPTLNESRLPAGQDWLEALLGRTAILDR